MQPFRCSGRIPKCSCYYASKLRGIMTFIKMYSLSIDGCKFNNLSFPMSFFSIGCMLLQLRWKYKFWRNDSYALFNILRDISHGIKKHFRRDKLETKKSVSNQITSCQTLQTHYADCFACIMAAVDWTLAQHTGLIKLGRVTASI